ncbi:Uncharacterized protein BM_BM10032 [Brugia malayi]|uniref:Uncharacterized protein n=1 Tax=Brugia malayi TaxID=6279 RepID=A0A4E9FSA5_BRUMA|nr:Uncharacterized protein BM_BM10032 [Brugia malayi]VIP00088.1 Uncharacterized protein BM_BM10032 [Brugia malayi]
MELDQYDDHIHSLMNQAYHFLEVAHLSCHNTVTVADTCLNHYHEIHEILHYLSAHCIAQC